MKPTIFMADKKGSERFLCKCEIKKCKNHQISFKKPVREALDINNDCEIVFIQEPSGKVFVRKNG